VQFLYVRTPKGSGSLSALYTISTTLQNDKSPAIKDKRSITDEALSNRDRAAQLALLVAVTLSAVACEPAALAGTVLPLFELALAAVFEAFCCGW
jgi:hypothetical protein